MLELVARKHSSQSLDSDDDMCSHGLDSGDDEGKGREVHDVSAHLEWCSTMYCLVLPRLFAYQVGPWARALQQVVVCTCTTAAYIRSRLNKDPERLADQWEAL